MSPLKTTGNEGGIEREDQVHARQRMLGDPVWARVHWLALRRERTRLPGRQPEVCIVVEDERDGIIAPHAMDQMPDTLRERRAISAEGDDRNIGIRKLRACCKRNDATMEPMETVALNFVRAVAVTTDIVAKGRPATDANAVLPAHTSPPSKCHSCRSHHTRCIWFSEIVLGKERGGAARQSDIHDEEPACSKTGDTLFVFRGASLHH